MGEQAWHGHTIDVTTPSAARMYDWLLGGSNNYVADRLAGEELLKIAPSTRELALQNREFLMRVVEHIVREHRITQFIDHGSGLPTQDNVHQVAQRVNPESRVVYVDNDPIVLSHGRTLLRQDERVEILQTDMSDTDAIFGNERVTNLLDLSKPTAALFVSVLHCLPDEDDPAGLLRRTAERLTPGSVMVICQLVSEDQAVRDGVTNLMKATARWGRVRTEQEVNAYFDGLEVKEPGLMDVTFWRPDGKLLPRQRTREWIEYGGLAVIPER
ncbi:SAM-dependent methyltransferase [Kitasatospora sp. NPDC096147]|uniref:SAM-dependent methyltransferase n=1 Tax=Kitasatospora sp. NPDC096147 TaxID=3364093 RepID=UPI0038145D3B